MKGCKLVKLKGKSDQEVFDFYQQARREMDTFYRMGCAEDEAHIAHMNKWHDVFLLWKFGFQQRAV
jgi:hypothetical protein